MGIEGLVEGHDREPETWHEYVDEEEGSKGAQCHEGQHGKQGASALPRSNMGRGREDDVLLVVRFPWGAC